MRGGWIGGRDRLAARDRASSSRARAALPDRNPRHPWRGRQDRGPEADALPSGSVRAGRRHGGRGASDSRGAGSASGSGRVRSGACVESHNRKDRSMKVLVTGITGFAGSHLVDYILAEKKGVEIVGIQRWRSRTENVEHFLDRVRMVECDLRDASSVRDLLDEKRP